MHYGGYRIMADAVDNETAPAPFNEALRLALRSADMPGKELARRTKRSPAAVSQWLHGKDVPPVDVVLVIEKHLGLAEGTLVYHVEVKNWSEDGRPVTFSTSTLEEEFNSALVRHPRLDEDQKVMIRDVVERFIKVQ